MDLWGRKYVKYRKGLRTLLILIATLIVIYVAGPIFYVNQAFFESLIVFMMLSLSFNLIYGFTGYLPFGYAAFFAIGAYGFGIGVVRNFGLVPSLLLAILFSLALGLVFSPMLKLRGAYFAIANLAAFEGVYYIISNQSLTPITRGPYGISTSAVFNPTLTYWISFAALLATVLITYVVRTSNFGLALRAIRDDPTVASLSGINVVLYRSIAWLTSSILAGFSGGLFGWYISFFYPSSVFSINYSLFAIVFTIFGGPGTLIGPVIGAGVLYTIYDAVGLLYPLYFTLIFGILVILLILFLPEGLKKVFRRYLKWEML